MGNWTIGELLSYVIQNTVACKRLRKSISVCEQAGTSPGLARSTASFVLDFDHILTVPFDLHLGRCRVSLHVMISSFFV